MLRWWLGAWSLEGRVEICGCYGVRQIVTKAGAEELWVWNSGGERGVKRMTKGESFILIGSVAESI